ncbi:MAG: hypothetical protein ACI4QV_03695 [Acutalibacteraceae bacterium]
MKKVLSAVMMILLLFSFFGCGSQNVYSIASSDESSSDGSASYEASDSMRMSWMKFKDGDYYISFAGSINANGETVTQFIQGSKSGKDTAFILYENEKIIQHVFSLDSELYISEDLESYEIQEYDYSSKEPVFDSAMGGIFSEVGELTDTGIDDGGAYEKYSYDENTAVTYWFDGGDCIMIEVNYTDGDYTQTSVYTGIEVSRESNSVLFTLPEGAVINIK